MSFELKFRTKNCVIYLQTFNKNIQQATPTDSFCWHQLNKYSRVCRLSSLERKHMKAIYRHTQTRLRGVVCSRWLLLRMTFNFKSNSLMWRDYIFIHRQRLFLNGRGRNSCTEFIFIGRVSRLGIYDLRKL